MKMLYDSGDVGGGWSGRKATETSMAESFDDLVAKTTTPEVRAKGKAITRKYLAQMLIKEIRMLAGKSGGPIGACSGSKAARPVEVGAAG